MSVYWVSTLAGDGHHPALGEDLDADVVVVGAGIVGLTAAELLRRAGRRVVVLEARRIGRQATGRSTAKVTSQHGLFYRDLIERHGEETARIYAHANERAVGQIADMAGRLGGDCGGTRLPSWVYTRNPDRVDAFKVEAEAAAGLGLPASFTRDVPLPFAVAGAVRFDGQAQIHPARYLVRLAHAVADGGGKVCEDTRVVAVDRDDLWRVRTEQGHTASARHVIVATQMPVVPQGKFFARAFPFGHCVAAAAIDPSRAIDGMFYGADEGDHSFRFDRSTGETVIIAVGRRQEEGDAAKTEERAEELRRFLRDDFGARELSHLWTSEDFAPMDGLPFAGQASSDTPGLYVATGFNAWGLTNGTVAAEVLVEMVLGGTSPQAALFDTGRVDPVHGAMGFLKGNMAAARHLVGDRLVAPPPPFCGLDTGDGGVFKLGGDVVAICRDDDGRLRTLSGVCTHLGCHVAWNPVDRTWDCPCHGSRFDADGTVLAGPATHPLEERSATIASPSSRSSPISTSRP